MRIKIEVPDCTIFITKIPVTISDINYGGHMGNDRFLTLMQEARLRWLQSLGFKNEKDITPTVGLIVADAAIQFKSEVFHGEILSVVIAAGIVTNRHFDLYYSMLKADGTTAALGKTGILSINYVDKTVVHIPDELRVHLIGNV